MTLGYFVIATHAKNVYRARFHVYAGMMAINDCAEYIQRVHLLPYSPLASYNRPPAADLFHIGVTTHIQVETYGADFMPKLAFFVIGTYEAVASCLLLQDASNEYIYFYAIVTNYNGPLAADIACVDVATHIKVAKFEASSTLTLTRIRPHTKL